MPVGGVRRIGSQPPSRHAATDPGMGRRADRGNHPVTDLVMPSAMPSGDTAILLVRGKLTDRASERLADHGLWRSALLRGGTPARWLELGQRPTADLRRPCGADAGEVQQLTVGAWSSPQTVCVHG